MNHRPSTSLSAPAANALYIPGARMRFFAPPLRIVPSVTALASAGVLGVTGVGVASSHTSVMLKVNGVSHLMASWGNTVGDALHATDMSVGSNNLAQPGTGEAVRNGDTTIVRTSKPHTVAVDGQTRTPRTTVSSADAILTDAALLGSTVSLTADRSSSRDELTPLVSRARNIVVTMDGTTRGVAARSGQDTRAILKASGVSVHPLGHVNVTTGEVGELSINVSRMTHGGATKTVKIPFSETTTTNSDLFVGESQVTAVGINGVAAWTVWQKKKGEEALTTVPITEHSTSQPVTQVRSEGTKEATPATFVAASIDPKATLEEKVKAGGTTSVRYRTKLGTISTKEEIAAIAADTKNTDSAAAAATVTAAAATGAIPTTYSGENPRSLAKPLVAAQDWGGSEHQCLVLLWNHEPQWNPYAGNVSSGTYGVPQPLPGSKMTPTGTNWCINPITQINQGIGYIKGRYGTPCSTWAHSNAMDWY